MAQVDIKDGQNVIETNKSEYLTVVAQHTNAKHRTGDLSDRMYRWIMKKRTKTQPEAAAEAATKTIASLLMYRASTTYPILH